MHKIKKYQNANGPITYNSSLGGYGLFSGSNFSLLNTNNLGSFSKQAPNINFNGAAGSIIGSGVSSLTGNLTSNIFGNNRFGQTGKYLVDTTVNNYAVPAITKTISGGTGAAKSTGTAAATAAKAGKLGSATNIANAAGIAATAASIAMGDKSEYSGAKGDLARNLDMAYDTLGAAANLIPGVGTFISSGMAVAGLGNQIMGKLGSSTDGMTTQDAILGSKLFNLGGLNPISMINGFGGKKAHTLQNASWQEQARMQQTADAYAQDERERADAAFKSGKKYGLFSRRARKNANGLIDDQSKDNEARLDIYNNNLLSEIRSQRQSSINNLGYMNFVNGGLEPVSVGKHGMRIVNRSRLKNIVNKAASLSNKVQEVNEVEQLKQGGKSEQKKSPRTIEQLVLYANEQKPPFIQRILNNDERSIPLIMKDGKKHPGTHLLSYGEVDGKTYVFPEIQDIDGDLIRINWPANLDIALENGNVLEMTPEEAKLFTEEYKKYYPNYKPFKEENGGQLEQFKQGGQMNVIPEGALHARKNNMELAKEGEITHKGVPVVDKDGNQQAEVEVGEITFTKKNTDKIEEWYKKYFDDETSKKEKDQIAIECGKFLTKEILFNTDDRIGLINQIEEKL